MRDDSTAYELSLVNHCLLSDARVVEKGAKFYEMCNEFSKRIIYRLLSVPFLGNFSRLSDDFLHSLFCATHRLFRFLVFPYCISLQNEKREKMFCLLRNSLRSNNLVLSSCR